MNKEIRDKYLEAGYQSMAGLNEKEAYKRLIEVQNRAVRNPSDIEIEWIAMGCASAYSDMKAASAFNQ